MTVEQLTGTSTSILLGSLVGLILGGIAVGLVAHLNAKAEHTRLEAQVASYAEEKRWLENSERNLRTAFELLLAKSEANFANYAARCESAFQTFGAESLRELNEQSRTFRQELASQARANSEDFSQRIASQLTSHAGTIGLLKSSLETNIQQLDQYVRELEAKREGAYATLRETFEAFTSQSVTKLTDQSRANANEFSGKLGTQLTSHAEHIGLLKSSLETNLGQMDQHVRELEAKREGAYAGLTENISSLREAYVELRDSTQQLVNALKTGPVRGRWGEIQLTRIIELAGMDKYVSFDEQVVGVNGKPDVVVRLPKDGRVSIDSKFPADSYIEAMTCADTEVRTQKLCEHVRTLRQTIKALADRNYPAQVAPGPELVILFVPIEACLMAAYENDPDIIEFAMSNRVMLASPITLLGFLKAIAYGWQQYLFSSSAKKIFEQGKQLYERAEKWVELYRKTGEKMGAAVEAYNASVASLQRRFYPAARRFQELSGISEELEEVAEIDEGISLPTPRNGDESA